MINKKKEWNKNKENGFAHAVIDNFLDEETCLKLYEECISAPKGGWTVFTRAGSRMEEFNDLISCPTAHQVTYEIMHSGEMLYDLEQMTGISGLLPDPHLVGAGYSIFRNGSFLSSHYDFNWNDRLRLHRKLTSLLFITPGWKEKWGGHHELWTGSLDKDKTSKKVYSHAPLFNRFFIDENVKKGPYHAVSKINCFDDVVGRCAIRFFYYISSSEYDPNDPPHKSIYTTNEYTHHKLHEEEYE
jgi:Rps23 Pro-64 3,4-dihydroxylase Tpa1-like proline 4-hydroxylase